MKKNDEVYQRTLLRENIGTFYRPAISNRDAKAEPIVEGLRWILCCRRCQRDVQQVYSSTSGTHGRLTHGKKTRQQMLHNICKKNQEEENNSFRKPRGAWWDRS